MWRNGAGGWGSPHESAGEARIRRGSPRRGGCGGRCQPPECAVLGYRRIMIYNVCKGGTRGHESNFVGFRIGFGRM